MFSACIRSSEIVRKLVWNAVILTLFSFSAISDAAVPVFTTPSSAGRSVPVSETSPAGTSVYKVVAVDADGDVLVYSLTSQYPSSPQKFNIDSKTGVMSTLSTFDVDSSTAVKQYEISIRVTDGTGSVQTTLVMEIIDENDNSPVFSHYYVIRQKTKPGLVVADIRAEDADSDRNGLVKYKITGGNEDNAFGIDADVGVLYTMYQLDPRQQDIYLLVIEARDSGPTPRSSTTTMTLTLSGDLGNGAAYSKRHVFPLILFCSFTLIIISTFY